MDYVLLALAVVSMVISIITLILVSKKSNGTGVDIDALHRKTEDSLRNLRGELENSTKSTVVSLGDLLDRNQSNRHEGMQKRIDDDLEDMANLLAQFNKRLSDGMRESREENERKFSEIRQELDTKLAAGLGNLEKRLTAFTDESGKRLNEMRETISLSLHDMREDNNKKLAEIQDTVDKKLQSELQKRISESFETVSTLLKSVQQDIGSMRTLADDVGGLKKTLSNVKTRGMMGEFQLESILSDIFSHDQFEKNAHPDKESSDVVEFALKIPTDDGDTILLPIDSKFPRDRYEAVLEASAGSDKAALDSAIKVYISAIKSAAKDIHDKYIRPPHTTDFALLFLPTESMYADAVNRDMLPEIWRLYKVYITGPSTISALLSSMQLAFNNMAIQKRAGEVFSILSEVQEEFSKFEDVLQNMQKHLNATSDDLSKLMGVRTRKINSRLSSIRKLSQTSDTELPVLPPVAD